MEFDLKEILLIGGQVGLVVSNIVTNKMTANQNKETITKLEAAIESLVQWSKTAMVDIAVIKSKTGVE